MIALTCALTMAVRIPSPTKGYINLGDCAVLVSGWLLGPVYGSIAAGFGSALADLLSGYPIYVPGTMFIKAGMAFVISIVPYHFCRNGKNHLRIGFIIGSVIAEAIMTAGYYLYAATVIGKGFIPALAGVSGNIVQGIAGAATSYFLLRILSHSDVFRMYGAGSFEKGQEK